MGYTYCQSVVDGNAGTIKTAMEFLGTGDNDANCIDVLCKLLQPVQQPRKRLGGNAEFHRQITSKTNSVRLRGGLVVFKMP